jgi:hypothetical protein
MYITKFSHLLSNKNTNFRRAETIGTNHRKIFTLESNLIRLRIQHAYAS